MRQKYRPLVSNIRGKTVNPGSDIWGYSRTHHKGMQIFPISNTPRVKILQPEVEAVSVREPPRRALFCPWRAFLPPGGRGARAG